MYHLVLILAMCNNANFELSVIIRGCIHHMQVVYQAHLGTYVDI